MAIQTEFNESGGVLRVTARGFDDSYEEAEEYSKNVLLQALITGCKRILCDERELEYRLSELDTFRLAEAAAAHVTGDVWVAIVPQPESLNDLAMFDMVAVHRGLEVRAFRDMSAAERWIQESFVE